MDRAPLQFAVPPLEPVRCDAGRRLPLLIAVALACVVASGPFSTSGRSAQAADAAERELTARFGPIEGQLKSEYSNIRIRRLDSTRTLTFVRDNGEEVVESMVDLSRPQDLLIEYTQYMFLSYVHRPAPKKVLIVGLGGGAMVHFLRRYDASVEVHVVEIDPAIIRVAQRAFDIRDGGKVKIVEADGFKFLAETPERYDVIYMDAFLKPSKDTDPNGVPLALKTARFYQQLQERLTPGGLVVYNLNPHSGSRQDIAAIAAAFRQTYVYQLPSGGFVVAASTSPDRDAPAAILKQARALDRRFNANFSFERLTRQLQR